MDRQSMADIPFLIRIRRALKHDPLIDAWLGLRRGTVIMREDVPRGEAAVPASSCYSSIQGADGIQHWRSVPGR